MNKTILCPETSQHCVEGCFSVCARSMLKSEDGRMQAYKSITGNKKKNLIVWKNEPEAHDYPAALSYLRLYVPARVAQKIVKELEHQPMSAFKAKDIFRATGTPMLDASNFHVAKNLNVIDNGEKLSPILLAVIGSKPVILDGYHRMCAVYKYDEDAIIPCKITYICRTVEIDRV